MHDGITVATLVLIASFAIDRIAAATFFLLTFLPAWNHAFPDPALLADPAAKATATRNRQLVYYLYVGALALIAVLTSDITVLKELQMSVRFPWDTVFSTLVLMGGSGQIAQLLGGSHAAPQSAPASPPIEVRGTITLEDGKASTVKHSGD